MVGDEQRTPLGGRVLDRLVCALIMAILLLTN